jgi:hypothetical protein
MLARSEIIRIGAGSLVFGLLVGAAVGVLTSGTASTQSTATTTSSTRTTTTSPAPNTTIMIPRPVVLEFVADPSDAVCDRRERRTPVVLIWSSQDTDAVSIEADGTAIVLDAGPTGRRAVALACPAAGDTQRHDLQLTATAADGRTASKSATVTVATGTNPGRDGRPVSPDNQG